MPRTTQHSTPSTPSRPLKDLSGDYTRSTFPLPIYNVSEDYLVLRGFDRSFIGMTRPVTLSSDSELKLAKGKHTNSKTEPASNSKLKLSKQPNYSRPSTSARIDSAAQPKFVDLSRKITVESGFDRSFIRAGAGAVTLTNSSPSHSARKISGNRR